MDQKIKNLEGSKSFHSFHLNVSLSALELKGAIRSKYLNNFKKNHSYTKNHGNFEILIFEA